jgi:hypothetical protein
VATVWGRPCQLTCRGFGPNSVHAIRLAQPALGWAQTAAFRRPDRAADDGSGRRCAKDAANNN